MDLQLKLDAETNAPVLAEDGRIIYIDKDDGDKELPLDPPGMYLKISDLGKENEKHRKKYTDVVTLYKPLEGIENIEEWVTEAKTALQTVKNFNDKDYLKAEKVEELKKQMNEAYEEKLKAKDMAFLEKENSHKSTVDGLNLQIRKLLVSNKFANSSFFNGENPKTILPANIAEDHFGKHFQVEAADDGTPTIKALYSNGDPVLSKINPGEPAEFEEAIELIINQYPGKDAILKSAGGGSGGSGGTGSKGGSVDDLQNLQKQLDAAKEKGDVAAMIAIKNKMAEIRTKRRAA